MFKKLFDFVITKRVSTFTSKKYNFEMKFPEGWFQSRISRKTEFIFFEKTTNYGLILNLYNSNFNKKFNELFDYHKNECLEDEFMPNEIDLKNGICYHWNYTFEESETLQVNRLLKTNLISLEWSYCFDSKLEEDDLRKEMKKENLLFNSILINNEKLEKTKC